MKIEGKNSVRELLKTGKTIDKVLVANGMRDAESKMLVSVIKSAGVKVSFADKSILDKESETRRHQGFIAYVSDYKYAELGDILNAVKDKDDAFIVILDGVEGSPQSRQRYKSLASAAAWTDLSSESTEARALPTLLCVFRKAARIISKSRGLRI